MPPHHLFSMAGTCKWANIPIRHTKPALPQRLLDMQANDTVADTDSESDSGSDSHSACDDYDTEYEQY